MAERSPAKIRDFAVEAVRKLRTAGFESLWAGGCVRDQLLGKTPKDYDVATNASPEQVREVFGRRRTIPVGASFGVITLVGPPDVGNLDVATFRQDAEYSDGRRPDSVTFGDAKLDAQRRDFTINGLFFDPLAEEVIDYVGGQEDLKAGIVRAIGDPDQRIGEDKLRMLRAVRFTASLGFAFDPATRAAVERHATEIIRVSPERIAMEMRRMLSHPTRAEAVELLRAVGLLEAILPEAFAANPDDWAAMMRALKAYGDGDFAVALALVLRFSGVVGGKRVTPRSLQQRWRLSNEETQRMEDALAMESVLLEADKLPWPVVQRQLIRENARGSLGYVQALAETLSTRKEGIQFCLNRLSWPTEKLNPTPLVTGDDLVALGLRPGRHFKAVLDRIRDLQLEGKLTAKEAALDEARRLAEESAA